MGGGGESYFGPLVIRWSYAHTYDFGPIMLIAG